MAAITLNSRHPARGLQHRVRRPQDEGQPTSHAERPRVGFDPLPPDILNEAIPAFFIGRNKAGLWVAREAAARTGGLFLFKSSALAFAHAQGGPAGSATIFPSQRFELDLDNQGNRLAGPLSRLMPPMAAPRLRIIRRTCRLALLVLAAAVAIAAIIAVKTIVYLPHPGFGGGVH